VKVGTKEFYELMEQFERDFAYNHPVREGKESWKYQHFYANVNDMFLAYMAGYSFGKSVGDTDGAPGR